MKRDIPTEIKFKIDKIAGRFESQWKEVGAGKFDALLNEIGEKYRWDLLEVLIGVDVELRLKSGQHVDSSDYEKWGSDAVEWARQQLAGNQNDEAPTIPSEQKQKIVSTRESSSISSRQIGTYKLLQHIGEGGMGTVWMAGQEKPVRRRVALKLIRADIGSKEAIARFEAERQALAMMDHQNIAKVLDAGTTEDGSPYFVMELVKGIPLTQFCNDHKLSIRERLELFVPVCKAVQHAHQKGILHRDLKPSNVLVTMHDGDAVPKVIDFGLAKALEHTTKLTDKTMFTEFGQVVGTLQYMSPEQAEMNALDIDTRSDIYSLGVVLYELLTGTTPLDKATIGRNALLQVLEIIREKVPPRPSNRLSSSGDAVTRISEQRKISPVRLQQVLRAELDWVVMKALDKDRQRRYETANDFAEDIQRYLDDETVQARPPTTTYRLAKFVKKNVKLVSVAAAILILLIGGIVGTSWGLYRANLNYTKLSEAADERTKALATAENFLGRLSKSNFDLAKQRFSDNQIAEAISLLDQIPMKYRNLEWSITRNSFDQSFQTLHANAKGGISFDAAGRLLTSNNSTVRIWDIVSGDQDDVRQIGNGAAVWSQDGSLLAVRSHQGVKIFDAKSTNAICSLNFAEANPNRRKSPTCVAFGYGSLSSVGLYDGSVVIFDSITGKKIAEYEGHQGSAECVACSPDGKLIAVGREDFDADQIEIRDATNGRQIRKFHIELEGQVSDLEFSPNSKKFVLARNLPTVEIRDVDLGVIEQKLVGKNRSVARAAFASDGQYIVSSSDHNASNHWIEIFDSKSGELIKSFEDGRSFAISPDGKDIAFIGNYATKVLVYRIGHDELIELEESLGGVDMLAFARDGTQIVGISSGEIYVEGKGKTFRGGKVWDLKSRKVSDYFTPPPFGKGFVEDSKGQLLFVAQNGSVSAFDLESGSFLELINTGGGVAEFAVSNDGKRIFTCSRDTVKLWDAETYERIPFVGGHLKKVNSVSISPDGSLIASASDDQSVICRELKTGTVKHFLDGHSGRVTAVRFSPSGNVLASCADDGLVKIWDTDSGEEMASFADHEEGVADICFSPDASRLASASNDKTVRLWDWKQKKLIQTWRGHLSGVRNVAFSFDGTVVASSSGDKTVKLWDAKLDHQGNTYQWRMFDNHQSSTRLADIEFNSGGSTLAASIAGIGSSYLVPRAKQLDTNTYAKSDLHEAIIQEVKERFGEERVGVSGFQVEDIQSMSYSPDGKTLYLGTRFNNVVAIDTKSRKQVFRINHAPSKRLNRFRFIVKASPDGGHLITLTDNLCRCWRLTDGEPIELWHAELSSGFNRSSRYSNHSVHFRGQSSLPREVIIQGPNAIAILDFDSGVHRRSHFRHTRKINFITCGALSRDGSRFVHGRTDGTIVLWDFDSGRVILSRRKKGKYAARRNVNEKTGVVNLLFSKDDSRLFATYSDGTIGIWDTESGQLITDFLAETDVLEDAVLADDDLIFATASRSGNVKLWYCTQQPPLAIGAVHVRTIASVAVSPDGQFIAFGDFHMSQQGYVDGDGGKSLNANIHLLSASTKDPISLRDPGFCLTAGGLQFSPDSKMLAAVGGITETHNGRQVAVWNLANNKIYTAPLAGFSNGAVAFSPDSKSFAVCVVNPEVDVTTSEAVIKILDCGTLREIVAIPIPEKRAEKLAYSEDSTQLYVTTKRNKYCFNLETREEIPGGWRETKKVARNQSTDGRIQAYSFDNYLCIVAGSSPEKGGRKRALIKHTIENSFDWHARQAGLAEKNENWFQATYHLGSMLHADRHQFLFYDRFHSALGKLKDATKMKTEMLPTIVQKAFRYPRGTRLPVEFYAPQEYQSLAADYFATRPKDAVRLYEKAIELLRREREKFNSQSFRDSWKLKIEEIESLIREVPIEHRDP